ncbi:hypothetical protein TYRP_004321 [Tyrophagus putrescentiae]|nr:hypothetical protein TYRP_004321 [Tyrophagus putrescentiae]
MHSVLATATLHKVCPNEESVLWADNAGNAIGGCDEAGFNEKGHLKHDVKDQYYVDIDDKTNSKELDYYNFKLHDYDNNMLLDGLELLMALNHDHDAHNTENKAATTAEPTDGQRQHQQQGKFDQDALLVDHILTVYDTDKDGYISFYEYMTVKEHNK